MARCWRPTATTTTPSPTQLGRRLFEAANEPKQFITIHGGDHNDRRDRAYYEKLRDFVAGLPASDKTTTGQTK